MNTTAQNAARECLLASEVDEDHPDGVYVRIPRDLWERWEQAEAETGRSPSVSWD